MTIRRDPIADRVDERYRKRRREGKPGWADESSYREKEACVRRLVQEYGLAPGTRALELGCGAGNITLFMVSMGLEGYGIDSSAEAIAWAKERRAASGLQAELRQGDVLGLAEFSDEWFGLVFDGDCLHRIVGVDRAKCLRNVYRVLEPGGVFHAVAVLVNEAIEGTVSVAPDIVFDPRTRLLTCEGKPYDLLSLEEEFLEELRGVGFVVAKFERKPRRADAETFEGGLLLVDAVRPSDE